MTRLFSSAPRLLRATLAAAVLLNAAGAARADAFTDRANATLTAAPADKRSDTVLLPVVAKMTAPPAVLESQAKTALFGSRGPGWEETKAWTQAPEQAAVIAALDTVTKELDRRKSFVFAQPYGVEGVDLDLIELGMYTELGDPPTLAAAEHGYMPALERTGILVHAEASRLAEAGDPGAAIDLLVDWFFFSRQMADRAFYKEKRWGMDSMLLSLRRVRDLVYQDSLAQDRKLQPEKMKETVEKISNQHIQLDRVRLPDADFAARQQLIGRVMTPRAGINADTFAPTMARIAAQDRPLRLFSAAAYWRGVGAAHADERETSRKLEGVVQDWNRRWNLPPSDKLNQTISEYNRTVANRPSLSLLHLGLGEVSTLFPLRRSLETEIAGTRASLGVYGYWLRQRTLPPHLAATRPAFVRVIESDPYSTSRQPLQYTVVAAALERLPGERENRQLIVRLYPRQYPEFQIPIPADQFLLYSVGPDDVPQLVRDATQGQPGKPGDYLLWPPELSLVRRRLEETNQLK